MRSQRRTLDEQHDRARRAARASDVELVLVMLVVLGIAMVASASGVRVGRELDDPWFFLRRQLLWAVLGLAVFHAARRFPTELLRRIGAIALPVVAGVLLVMPWIGEAHGGAVRWLSLGPITVQPSEAAKLALVLFLAHFAAERELPFDARTTLTGLAIVGGTALLVALGRDLGSALVVAALGGITLFVAGARLAHLAGAASMALPVVLMGIAVEGFRVGRVRAWLAPWEHAQGLGYQAVQSFIAFGSGGWHGRGLGGGLQKLFYLPEAHTDFVLANAGEELGFLGVVVIVGLFTALLALGTRIALDARDAFGTTLAAGLTALVAIPAGLNMAVCLGMVPTTGLTLPFLSYGGSSLLVCCAALGLLVGVDRAGPPNALARVARTRSRSGRRS